jgi:predicted SAM-dependent methyltransferase
MGVITRLKRTESPAWRSVLLRARAAPHWAMHGHLVARRAIAAHVATTDEPRLHFGAGPTALPGWLNTDIIRGEAYLNLGRRLPVSDGVFAYAFGEHVIEHLLESTARALLRELHRVLRPGGVLRLATPDLAKLIAIYEDRNPEVDRATYARYLDEITGKRHQRACQILNDDLRLWGHQYIYDEEDLAAKLREAGFQSVERLEAGESPHPVLRGLESHAGPEWLNRAEVMCLEATR